MHTSHTDLGWSRLLSALTMYAVVLWSCLLVAAEAASPGQRQEATSKTLPISLEQSVMLALQNNMDVRIERLSPLIRAEEVRREGGVFFAPRLSVEVSTDRSQRPTGSVLAGAQVLESQNLDMNTGVSLRSLTGGAVSVDFRNKRFETNSVFQLFDPQYTSELALTLTHPLLKNFGTGVNGVRIKVAQNNVQISKHQLEIVVTNLIVEVQQTYWDLVLGAHDLAARRRSLGVAQHLHRRTMEMVSRGRLPALATLQAKTAVVERELELVAAENALADAQARLRTLLNLDKATTPHDLTLVPTDVPLLAPQPVSVEEGLKSAMTRRPELFQAKLDQENRVLGVQLARNQRLPEINLVGSVGLSGLSGNPTDNPLAAASLGGVPLINLLPDGQNGNTFEGGYEQALGKLFSGDFFSYKVGVNVHIPLGNQLARSELTKAKLEVEKSKLFLQTLEQKIALEIEVVARGINSRLKAIDGARALRHLTEQKLNMAQEGLDLGVSSVTDVLEAQRNVTMAQRDEMRTTTEYQKLLSFWEKATGTALERFHIDL
jgi:outer membrane protein